MFSSKRLPCIPAWIVEQCAAQVKLFDMSDGERALTLIHQGLTLVYCWFAVTDDSAKQGPSKSGCAELRINCN